VQCQRIAVGILEARHVADAGVERLTVELDALPLELGAGCSNVVDVQQGDRVRLRRVLSAEPRRLPDREAALADPELVPGPFVGPQAKGLDVEGA